MKKIFLLLGHPDCDSLSGAFIQEYERGAREVGHEVRLTHLGDTHFDPILHRGYKEIQELEPDLVKIQEDMRWADHIVIFYPNWWFTMPALLKGMFDRMFLPGFAFRFNKQTKKIDQLLKGKSARVIIVSGTFNPFVAFLKFGDFTNEIRLGTLGFAGMSPVRVTNFGPSEHCSDKKRDKWKKKVYELGKEGR
jgi:NAD(P)H dehydrogenase (quinone)